MDTHNTVDALVIGAGFGGLAAALTLGSLGARVALCETLKYPGGCASTFQRDGYHFEAGATLFSGFDEGQFFHRWMLEHHLPVTLVALDPVVELRTRDFSLAVPSRREALVDRFCSFPDAPQKALRVFFSAQEHVANALWSLLDDPSLLPPFGVKELFRHAARTPRYLPLLRLVGQPLEAMLHRFELQSFTPLRSYLDAVCQITIQTDATSAESPFALGAIDYFFRGVRHVHGGIGELAWALAHAAQQNGVAMQFSNAVKQLRRDGDTWIATTRKGTIRARAVIANLLPQSVATLATLPVDEELQHSIEDGWGAAMLYLGVRAENSLPEKPFHLECVHDPSKPFQEGNHIFCSVSALDEVARAPAQQRTVTISTHVPMKKLLAMSPEEQGTYIADVQQSMRETLRSRAPELAHATVYERTASPRTFERFTGRHHGYVGGIPRKAGLHHYRHLLPTSIAPDLYLVGDSVFPGQSTLATALGGYKLAHHIARRVL